MDGENKGHGHVYKRPDGARARCGGPRMCAECAHDQAEREQADAARRDDRDALIRAEGWRAGYAAGLQAAEKEAYRTPLPEHFANNAAQGHAWLCASGAAAERIRSLDIPEETNG